jgi:hypothetical protein
MATKNGALPKPATQCTPIRRSTFFALLSYFSAKKYKFYLFYLPLSTVLMTGVYTLLSSVKKSSTIYNHFLMVSLEGS